MSIDDTCRGLSINCVRKVLAASRRKKRTSDYWFVGSKSFIEQLVEGEPRNNFLNKIGRSHKAIHRDKELLLAEYGDAYAVHVTIRHRAGPIQQPNGHYIVGNADIVERIHEYEKL